jgi:tetratricopeptide (TPR) repeat protein
MHSRTDTKYYQDELTDTYLTIFQKLLKEFTQHADFSKAILTFQNNANLETMQLLNEICSEDRYSHEEKWFACYFRRLVSLRLLQSDLTDSDKFMYKEKLTEDRMMLAYHLMYFTDYDNKIIHITADNSATSSSDSSSDAQINDSPPRKTKAQMKVDKHNRKIESWVRKGEEFTEKGNLKDAANSFQQAITLGSLDWNVFLKCLQTYVATANHHEVIRLSMVIITGIANEEKSTDKSLILYLSHIHCAYSYVKLHPNPTGLDHGFHHYKEAEKYQGEEVLPAVGEGLATIACNRMRYFRYNAVEQTTEQKADNQQMTMQYATEAYARLIAINNTEAAQSKTPKKLFDDYVALSEVAYFSKKPEECVFYLKKVVAIDSSRFHTYKHLAIAYSSLGEFKKAIESIETLLAKIGAVAKVDRKYYPFISEICFIMGVCQVYDGQNTKAFQSFLLCQSISVCNQRAILALLQLERVAASGAINNVKHIFKKGYDLVLQDLGNLFDRAEEPFLCSFILGLHAFMYLKNKQLSLAIDTYERAAGHFTLTPMNQKYYDNAKVLMRARTDKDALKEFGLLAPPKPNADELSLVIGKDAAASNNSNV